jgi:hypothetical protein
MRDFHRNGRHPVDHIDDDRLCLLRTFPFPILRTLAENAGVSLSTILQDLPDSLGLTLYHFRRVPHELKRPLKEKRVVISRELLELLKMEETFRFTPAVTGDELSLYLTYLQTQIVSVSDDERPVRVENTIANERHMLTVLWFIKGVLVIEWLERGDRFNTTCFRDVIIAKLVQTLYPGGLFRGDENFHCIWTMLVLRFVLGQLNLSMEKDSSD